MAPGWVKLARYGKKIAENYIFSLFLDFFLINQSKENYLAGGKYGLRLIRLLIDVLSNPFFWILYALGPMNEAKAAHQNWGPLIVN